MKNNYVKLKGFLGNSPEFFSTNKGKEYARLSIGINDNYFDKKEQKWIEGQTKWFKATAWLPSVIKIARNLEKGKLISVDAFLDIGKYKISDDKEVNTTDIVITDIDEIVVQKNS